MKEQRSGAVALKAGEDVDALQLDVASGDVGQGKVRRGEHGVADGSVSGLDDGEPGLGLGLREVFAVGRGGVLLLAVHQDGGSFEGAGEGFEEGSRADCRQGVRVLNGAGA